MTKSDNRKKLKKTNIAGIILLLPVLIFGVTFTALAVEQTVEFGSSETPPFWSAHLPEDGMAGEILHAMSSEIDVKSVIKYLPLKRIRKDLIHNHVGNPDNFAGQEFSAVIPIAVFRAAFLYYKPNHKKEIIYRVLDDIKGYTLGVIRGTLVDIPFFDNKGIKVEQSNSEDSLLKKLKHGRIDLCSVIKLSGIFKIRKLFPKDTENFVHFEIKGSVSPVTIMIAKNHPGGKELGKKYSKGLKIIIENGKYNKIIEKYYGKKKIPQDWFMQLEKFKYMLR
jgi:polar amino acid transport system substrate-binding protein